MHAGMSPSQVLQIEVYHADRPLLLTAGPTHLVCDDNGRVVVEQSRLDVELWINITLKVELTKRRVEYRSLIDIQLYEVMSLPTCVQNRSPYP